MTPPDMLDEQAADRSTTVPTGPSWSDRAGTDANLRTELVHRHLAARIGVAEEQLQILEDHSPAPEVLVARFGATITEAQAVLDRERAEVAVRVEHRRQDTELQISELLAKALAEATAILEVAAEVRATTATAATPPASGRTGRCSRGPRRGRGRPVVNEPTPFALASVPAVSTDPRLLTMHLDICRMRAELELLEGRISRIRASEAEAAADTRPFVDRAQDLVDRTVASLLEAGRAEIEATDRQSIGAAEARMAEANRQARLLITAAREELAAALTERAEAAERAHGSAADVVILPDEGLVVLPGDDLVVLPDEGLVVLPGDDAVLSSADGLRRAPRRRRRAGAHRPRRRALGRRRCQRRRGRAGGRRRRSSLRTSRSPSNRPPADPGFFAGAGFAPPAATSASERFEPPIERHPAARRLRLLLLRLPPVGRRPRPVRPRRRPRRSLPRPAASMPPTTSGWPSPHPPRRHPRVTTSCPRSPPAGRPAWLRPIEAVAALILVALVVAVGLVIVG